MSATISKLETVSHSFCRLDSFPQDRSICTSAVFGLEKGWQSGYAVPLLRTLPKPRYKTDYDEPSDSDPKNP